MTGPPGRRSSGDRGQATVELALALPLVVGLLLLVVQVGALIHDQVLVQNAAREAARTAAVDPSPDAPRAAAIGSSGLEAARATVELGPRGEAGTTISATVRYRSPVRVPLLGAAIPEVELSATTTMRIER